MTKDEWLTYLSEFISNSNGEEVILDTSDAKELVDLLKEESNATA